MFRKTDSVQHDPIELISTTSAQHNLQALVFTQKQTNFFLDKIIDSVNI